MLSKLLRYEGDVIDEVEFLVRSTRTPYIEDTSSSADDIEKAMK